METGKYPTAVRPEDSSLRPKKKKMKNKRFSDEQIKSLESMFEEETKLEPRRKLQLARELGLQPRQVAIWFQNRRARWKSKQLEREYNVLRANYDALASSFESLKKEKQSLLKQVQKLSDQLEKPRENRCCRSASAGNSTDGDSDNGENKCGECEEKPNSTVEEGPDVRVIVFSDGENSKNVELSGQDNPDLMKMAQPTYNSMLSERWCGFDSGYLSDQSCSDLQWWEFWH